MSTKAAAAYGELTGKSVNPTDEAAVNAERATGGPAFTEYTITSNEMWSASVASIGRLRPRPSFPQWPILPVTEMLGEKFHMNEAYLKESIPA